MKLAGGLRIPGGGFTRIAGGLKMPSDGFRRLAGDFISCNTNRVNLISRPFLFFPKEITDILPLFY